MAPVKVCVRHQASRPENVWELPTGPARSLPQPKGSVRWGTV